MNLPSTTKGDPNIVSTFEQIRQQNLIRNGIFLNNLGFDSSTNAKGEPDFKKQRHLRNVEEEQKLANKHKCLAECGFVPEISNNGGSKNYRNALSGHQASCIHFLGQGRAPRELRSQLVQSSSSNATNSRSNATRNIEYSSCIAYDDHEFQYDGDTEEGSDEDSNEDGNGADEFGNDNDGDNDFENNDKDSISFKDGGGVDLLELQDTSKTAPSLYVYDYQKMLQKTYSKTALLRVRKHRAGNPKNMTINDYIAFGKLNLMFGKITRKTGDFLLKVINTMLIDHGLAIHLQLPARWKSLMNSISKNATKETTVNVITVPVDSEVWGTIDDKGIAIKEPYGVGFNLLDIIAENFLNCKPENCIFEPKTITNNDGDVVVKDFATSNMFKQITNGVRNKHGETTILSSGKELRNVAICVTESEDEAALDKAKKVNGEPISVLFPNLIGVDSNVNLLGFHSQTPLEMSKASAHAILKSRGGLIQYVRDEMIKQRIRDVHMIFLKKLHKQFLEVYKNGIFMQIGRGIDAEVVVAFPVIYCNCGDNKGLDNLAGINSKMNGKKCRCCGCSNMNNINSQSPTRDHIMMKNIAELKYKMDRKLWFENLHKHQRGPFSAEHRAIEDNATKWNLIPAGPGSEFLFEVGQSLLEITDGEIKGLYSINPADQIHTIFKGPAEDVLVYTFECIYNLEAINKDKYGGTAALVDYRFTNFPRKHSVKEFYDENMARGITIYFSKDRSKKSGPGQKQGKLFGSLPASRLPGLVLMMSQVIGNNGDVLPQTHVIPMNHSNKVHQAALVEVLKDLNVETTVQNALRSCVDVISYCNRIQGHTTSDLKKLEKMIRLQRYHMAHLFTLRNTLKHCAKKSNKFISKDDVVNVPLYTYKGIKLHHCSHIPESIYEYGNLKLIDTDRTENSHIPIKGLYAGCSKNKSSLFQEMCKTLAVAKKINRLWDEVQRRKHMSEDDYTVENVIEMADKQPSTNIADPITFQFYFNHKTKVEFFSMNKGMLCINNQQFLHPFITLSNLANHLYGAKNKVTEEIIGGLKEESRKMFLEFIQQANTKGKVSMSLLGNIKCGGSTDLGIDPFDITCNQKVPRNCKNIERNQIYDHQFDHVEVKYSDNSETTVVKVLAIVLLQRKQNVKLNGTIFIKTESKFSLLVLRMESTPCLNSTHLKKRLLKYSLDKKGINTILGLNIDIIDISCVVRPAWVNPIFTKDFVPNYKERITDIHKDLKFWEFEHVIITKDQDIDLFMAEETNHDNIGNVLMDIEEDININEIYDEDDKSDASSGYDGSILADEEDSS